MARNIWSATSSWIKAPSLMPLNWEEDDVLTSWVANLTANTTTSTAKALRTLIILAVGVFGGSETLVFDDKERQCSA